MYCTFKRLMTVFSFFVISNTEDALDFHIEATAMNCRLRFSAMKSLHHRKYGHQEPIRMFKLQCKNGNENENENEVLPTYHRLLKGNYTYYLLEKKQMLLEETSRYKHELKTKIINRTMECSSRETRDFFTVTFNSFSW